MQKIYKNPDRTGPDQTGPDRTGPGRTGPGRTGPVTGNIKNLMNNNIIQYKCNENTIKYFVFILNYIKNNNFYNFYIKNNSFY